MKITILEPLAVEESKLRELGQYITDKGHSLEIYDYIARDDQEAIERVVDSDILVIANSPLSGEVIRSAKKLKMIAVAFTGVDHLDLDACRERNILVSNAAGYSSNSVAELAIGMIISLYRKILTLDEITRKGGTKSGYRQRDLMGKTLGIVGTGEIGSYMARLGLAFGCRVLAYSRSEKKDLIDAGVEYRKLNDLLKESDIVSLHLPLNDETKGLIGREEFKLMKEDGIIINAARGPIIDMEALNWALNEDVISGAGLDVFDMEPPLDENYFILEAKNTVLSPHIGFATEEAMIRRAEITFDNVYSWIEGKPKNIVE